MSSVLQSTVGSLSAGLNRERLRFWGIQSGVSILDQGLTSGASFVLNLFLARWLTAEGYGAFAIAFATLLFISGFHNVLVLEPMSVFGPASHAISTVSYFRAQLRVHFLLTAYLSVSLLLTAGAIATFGIQRELALATAASAVAFPLVLFLWLVRRMCYVVHRPSIAVWASAGYLALLLVGLFLMHRLGRMNPAAAIIVMALASVAAVLAPLCKLQILSPPRGTLCSWKEVLRENWSYGRWLVVSTMLYSVASQTQPYLVAALLGLGAAGILRAMQMPSLVMTQVVSAVGLLLLPTMAREYGRGHLRRLRRKAVYASVVLATTASAYAAALGIFARPIERLMYSGKFSSSAWLISVLGLVPVCTGIAAGFSMALRACQKPHFDLLANAISAPVGLVTALFFTKLWGLGGASISMVAGFATYAAVFFWSFLHGVPNAT
jgi:O-antigen/teichoic acid export membrane protein